MSNAIIQESFAILSYDNWLIVYGNSENFRTTSIKRIRHS